MPEDSVLMLLTRSVADTNGQALQLYRSLEAINRSVLTAVLKRSDEAFTQPLSRSTA